MQRKHISVCGDLNCISGQTIDLFPLRCFNLAFSSNLPEQEFDLSTLLTQSSHSSRFMIPNEDDDQRASSVPELVSFSFCFPECHFLSSDRAPAESADPGFGWLRFAVLFTSATGHLYTLNPVIPYGCAVPERVFADLNAETMALVPEDRSQLPAEVKWRLCWLEAVQRKADHMETTIEEEIRPAPSRGCLSEPALPAAFWDRVGTLVTPDGASGEPFRLGPGGWPCLRTSPVPQALRPWLRPVLSGPLESGPASHEDPFPLSLAHLASDPARRVTHVSLLGTMPPLVITAQASAQLRVFLLARDIPPRFTVHPGAAPSAGSTEGPLLVPLTSVRLALPPFSSSHAMPHPPPVWLTGHPLRAGVVLCAHYAGLHMLDLGAFPAALNQAAAGTRTIDEAHPLALEPRAILELYNSMPLPTSSAPAPPIGLRVRMDAAPGELPHEQQGQGRSEPYVELVRGPPLPAGLVRINLPPAPGEQPHAGPLRPSELLQRRLDELLAAQPDEAAPAPPASDPALVQAMAAVEELAAQMPALVSLPQSATPDEQEAVLEAAQKRFLQHRDALLRGHCALQERLQRQAEERRQQVAREEELARVLATLRGGLDQTQAGIAGAAAFQENLAERASGYLQLVRSVQGDLSPAEVAFRGEVARKQDEAARLGLRLGQLQDRMAREQPPPSRPCPKAAPCRPSSSGIWSKSSSDTKKSWKDVWCVLSFSSGGTLTLLAEPGAPALESHTLSDLADCRPDPARADTFSVRFSGVMPETWVLRSDSPALRDLWVTRLQSARAPVASATSGAYTRVQAWARGWLVRRAIAEVYNGPPSNYFRVRRGIRHREAQVLGRGSCVVLDGSADPMVLPFPWQVDLPQPLPLTLPSMLVFRLCLASPDCHLAPSLGADRLTPPWLMAPGPPVPLPPTLLGPSHGRFPAPSPLAATSAMKFRTRLRGGTPITTSSRRQSMSSRAAPAALRLRLPEPGHAQDLFADCPLLGSWMGPLGVEPPAPPPWRPRCRTSRPQAAILVGARMTGQLCVPAQVAVRPEPVPLVAPPDLDIGATPQAGISPVDVCLPPEISPLAGPLSAIPEPSQTYLEALRASQRATSLLCWWSARSRMPPMATYGPILERFEIAAITPGSSRTMAPPTPPNRPAAPPTPVLYPVAVWDMPGDSSVRDMWPNHVGTAGAVAFVVDGEAPRRWAEARQCLHRDVLPHMGPATPLLLLVRFSRAPWALSPALMPLPGKPDAAGRIRTTDLPPLRLARSRLKTNCAPGAAELAVVPSQEEATREATVRRVAGAMGVGPQMGTRAWMAMAVDMSEGDDAALHWCLDLYGPELKPRHAPSAPPAYGRSFLARIALIAYGEWMDAHMALKYTDIDYVVFTDAARFMHRGGSPFERATYRYTPLLAWLMIPNVTFHPAAGKMMFCLVDLLIGWFISEILRKHLRSPISKYHNTLVGLWLLNPISINVSSRGNAESLISVLVVATIYFLYERRILLAAVLFGLSVHFKIYPILYALPFVLLLSPEFVERKKSKKMPSSLWGKLQFMPSSLGWSVGALALTGLFYLLYGYEFLYEAYLYHVVRTDPRHNFSIYFYQLYLTHSLPSSFLLGLASFLPQLVLVVMFSVTQYRKLPLCLFLLTVCFVIFNKVCTVQYFVWYLSLLPLALPFVDMGWRAGLLAFGLWQGSQLLWLGIAYLLEFRGRNTFLPVWLASIIFFASNASIMLHMLRRPRARASMQ
ncbi:putative GPI mannosyltransferase 1 [Paratrimastix pyriformis]|uniref:GPI mannosyltransferase I n=1 Tax=Paratrimastix pyriformis TaxID=342808 RepID=A0ABQ8UMK2_9EUKA|nr:putative GPI mannosyltransferase 1 [Paratrimastix pyriformis]